MPDKANYKVASLEGVAFVFGRMLLDDPEAVSPGVGDEVKLELYADEKKALIAAGWLEEPEAPKEAKK